MKKIFMILSIILVILFLCFFINNKTLKDNNSSLDSSKLTINYGNSTYIIDDENSAKILKILTSLEYNIEQTDNLPNYIITTEHGEVYMLNTFSNCILHNNKQSYISKTVMDTILECINNKKTP